MSRCCRISSTPLHSSSLVLSSGLCTSSSSLLLLPSVPALATVIPLTLPPVLLLLLFLNQLLLLLVLAASVSEMTDAASSTRVLSAVEADATLRFDDNLARWFGSESGSIGACFGVGTGVTSVLGVASTSSASRYHFLRRV